MTTLDQAILEGDLRTSHLEITASKHLPGLEIKTKRPNIKQNYKDEEIHGPTHENCQACSLKYGMK